MKKYIVYKYIPDEQHNNEFNCMIECLDLIVKRSIYENLSGGVLIKWIYNFIVTLGKIKSCILVKNGRIIHYSFFSPYCYKYGFMDKGDFVIGPCWTDESMRGNRIFPKTISKIAFELSKSQDNNVYLLVRQENVESTNSVVNTNGWRSVGIIEKTRFLNYRKVEWFTM